MFYFIRVSYDQRLGFYQAFNIYLVILECKDFDQMNEAFFVLEALPPTFFSCLSLSHLRSLTIYYRLWREKKRLKIRKYSWSRVVCQE